MIKELPLSSIAKVASGVPSRVSARCASCTKAQFYQIGDWASHGSMRYATALCPECNARAYFVIEGFDNDKLPLGGGLIYMAPAFNELAPSQALEHELQAKNKEIHRDYAGALGAYNNGDSIGVVAASRRLLEGLVIQFIPQSQLSGNLTDDLKKLHTAHDLSDVLHGISEAVKSAGNLGVHYGASRSTQEIATKAWDMVNQLLDMHFLLEIRMIALRDLVALAHKEQLVDVAPDKQPKKVKAVVVP